LETDGKDTYVLLKGDEKWGISLGSTEKWGK
jgi:hypothetical protein